MGYCEILYIAQMIRPVGLIYGSLNPKSLTSDLLSQHFFKYGYNSSHLTIPQLKHWFASSLITVD